MSFVSNFRQAWTAALAAQEAVSAEEQAKAEAAAKAKRVNLGQQWAAAQEQQEAIEAQAKAFREKAEVLESLKAIDKGLQDLVDALEQEKCLPAQLAQREQEYLRENAFTKEILLEAGFTLPSAIPSSIWTPPSP